MNLFCPDNAPDVILNSNPIIWSQVRIRRSRGERRGGRRAAPDRVGARAAGDVAGITGRHVTG
jgi:hypothetical protein